MAAVVIRVRRISPFVLFGFRGVIIFLVLLPLVLTEKEIAIHGERGYVIGGGRSIAGAFVCFLDHPEKWALT
jgi:hypothetical protein